MSTRRHTPAQTQAQGSTSERARRRFVMGLMAAAGGAGALLTNALTVKPLLDAVANDGKAQPASAQRRWGLYIDTDKCAEGCDACVRGCDDEHGLSRSNRPELDARWIRKVTITDPQTNRTQSIPVMCQHCESAPCIDVCPTGASFRRADGIVLVNKHTCIGCRYCMMACPFGARSFIHEPVSGQLTHAPRGKGTVESCTLCIHRVDSDPSAEPACAQACRSAGYDAISFGDLNDEASAVSQHLASTHADQIRPDLELNGGVHYSSLLR